MAKTIKINNENIKYSVSRRKVKYARLEFRTGKLTVVIPRNMKNEEDILEKHKMWIYRKNKHIKNALKEARGKELNENMSKERLKCFVRNKVSEFSEDINIKINSITLKKMVSKWGSLSARKNMTINSYTRYLPEKLIEYIIFHEMTHLLVKKHDNNFRKIVSGKYENYKEYEGDLFKYWFLLQHKLGCGM